MFTGIIEALARVERIESEGSNVHFTLSCPFVEELKVDQSVAHNGACLTVVDIHLANATYTVTAIQETMVKTNLGDWKIGDSVNLERCVKLDGRLDGHMVQGHVDCTAVLEKVDQLEGSNEYHFKYDGGPGRITVSKGSICVNGVSLTVVKSEPNSFSVALIPYTSEHTNFGQLVPGDRVNIEFDILGKYIARLLENKA